MPAYKDQTLVIRAKFGQRKEDIVDEVFRNVHAYHESIEIQGVSPRDQADLRAMIAARAAGRSYKAKSDYVSSDDGYWPPEILWLIETAQAGWRAVRDRAWALGVTAHATAMELAGSLRIRRR